MLLKKLEKDLNQAINLAKFAPSSHNSQPWQIALVKSQSGKEIIDKFCNLGEINADYYLILSLNQERCLNSLAAHDLEMSLSCGAFLESLTIALASQNLQAIPSWYNSSINSNPLPESIALPSTWIPISIIAIGRAQEVIGNDIAKEKVAFFQKRITNRGPYQKIQIPAALIQKLKTSQSFSFPEIHHQCQITLIEEPNQIEQVGTFFKSHSRIEVTEPSVWKETYQWMHFGEGKIQQAEDGLPVTQLLGSLSPLSQQVYKVLLSPPSVRLLNSVGLADYIASEYAKLIEDAPLLVYFNFNSEDPSLKTQLGGGALWLNFCLNATAAGLAVQPMSVVLQHPDIRSCFQEKFYLPSGRGFFFCRIGYPVVSFPPAPKKKNPCQEVCML